MIPVRKESVEVLYGTAELVSLSLSDLEELKDLALKNHRKRARICTHHGPGDLLHEMFIVHTRETVIPVHKHLDRTESLTVLHGRVDLVLFHDDGKIRETVAMGEIGSGLPFYYRLSDPIFHTLRVRSPLLVFFEATTGPFRKDGTVFFNQGT